ncbi:hypothetical protein D3C84_390340 [compost metagenome]
MTKEGRRNRRDALAETDRLRQHTELFTPVVAGCGRAALAVALGIFSQHRRVVAELAGRGRLTARCRTIQLGDTLIEQVAAIAIEGDVVNAAVEEIHLRALQQSEATWQLALKVERLANLGHAPLLHPSLGIDPGRQLHLRHAERQCGVVEQHLLTINHEIPGQHLTLADRLAQRRNQQPCLDLAGEGDAFGGIEHGAVFIQHIAVPQALLGNSQAHHAAPPCCSIRLHQPFSVGVLARSVKLSSSPWARHSLSSAITWIESRP